MATMTLETLNGWIATHAGPGVTARYIVARVGSSCAGCAGDRIHVASVKEWTNENGLQITVASAPCHGSATSRNPPRVTEIVGYSLERVTCPRCLKWIEKAAANLAT